MKIAINTRFLLKNKLEGFGWFTYETLRRMVAAHPDDEFIFFFDRPYDPSYVFGKNVTPIVLFPPARHPFLFVWWYEWSVARALKKYKPDVFLSTDNFCSLRTSTPTCLMLHDVGWAHPEARQTLPWLVFQYYNFFAPHFLKKAETLVAVSSFVKEDALRYYPFLNQEKIVVCHNGCRTDFRPITEGVQRAVREKYTEGCPYFVFVGAVHPRKNVHRLIEAFSLMKKRTSLPHKLVIVGRFAWQTGDVRTAFDNSDCQKDIIFTGYVADEEVPLLVGAATAVTYVSLAEGFGIPILEAMNSDVPVVTSNVTSMPEVAGNAALLVNPFSVDEMADAIEKLAKDSDLRQNLIAKGQIQREKFSWDKTASVLYEVLKTLKEKY
ncbi:MAG: glycosyltransferase family 4 protein [Saprospiraceae bacterium]|nr:glycosyltransferase family 4 protein [Saprospiraceae bacterium]